MNATHVPTTISFAGAIVAVALGSSANAVEVHDFELVGNTQVVLSLIDKTCWVEDGCTDVEPTPIGTPESFTLAFRAIFTDDGEFIRLLSDVSLSGFNYDAPVIGSSFEFEGRRVIGGFVQTDTRDDICGGGVSLQLSYADFRFDRTTCYYDDTVFAFIHDIGWTPLKGKPSARITQYRDGVAIPEPSTWALLILGFGSAGVALRRRRLNPA